MELTDQRDLEKSFYSWFDGGLKKTIDDSRRRYRMELADSKERSDRGLSCLPSSKSTTIVDSAVDRAIQEFHLDPQGFSYTAVELGVPEKDALCQWLTQIVKRRAKRTFKLVTWHKKGLKALFTDGMVAAMASWRHETKTKETKQYVYVGATGAMVITKEQYDQIKDIDPAGLKKETLKEKVVVRDTWWLDLLMPGRDILWDPTAPLLDVNLGQWCLVKLRMSLSDINNQIANEVFNATTEEDLKKYQVTSIDEHSDDNTTGTDPATVDFSDLNSIEVWAFFDREGNDWGVQFSLKGEKPLSRRKPVNDVFFNGREVNCLPVVIGYADDELWENVGRGLPKVIAPLEDEATDHRNNYNDYAKQLLQGKSWVSPDSDIDIDDLINRPVVMGVYGQDFGQIPLPQGAMDVLRATDSINSEMNGLIPVSVSAMGSRVVQKGQNATLGTVQMNQAAADGKIGVSLTIYKETFFEQLLYLIAQLEFSWETDELVAKYAASKVPNGFQAPTDGMNIDFRTLDFDFDVQINAGLGSVPLQQKAQTLIQVGDWRKANGVPTDMGSIAQQLNVVTGYDAQAFDLPAPPQPSPPDVEYKATVNIDLAALLALAPEAGTFLMQKMLSGEMSVDAKVTQKDPKQREAEQNGGGLFTPDRTGDFVDATGPAAMGMSQGGMQSPGGDM